MVRTDQLMNNNNQGLNERIDELIELVQALTVEVQELRQERQQRQVIVEERGDQEFRRGDRIVILNNHRNEQGRTATVTRVHGERVYFTLDGRPTYRLRQNVERIQ